MRQLRRQSEDCVLSAAKRIIDTIDCKGFPIEIVVMFACYSTLNIAGLQQQKQTTIGLSILSIFSFAALLRLPV